MQMPTEPHIIGFDSQSCISTKKFSLHQTIQYSVCAPVVGVGAAADDLRKRVADDEAACARQALRQQRVCLQQRSGKPSDAGSDVTKLQMH